jgi:hypothetical protein
MADATTTYPVEIIARVLKLTPRRVQQLANEGVIPKAAKNRYALVPAVHGYIDFLKARAIGADLPEESGEHKRRLLKARADIAEMEASRLSGEQVSVEDVERTWTEIAARFRQRTLAVAPKAAPMVAVETSIDACHEIIETFIHEALAELAATPVVADNEVAIGARGAGDADDHGAAAEVDDLGLGGPPSAALE